MVKEGYKQTEIGVIPEDWEVLKLQECVVFLDHKRIPIKDSDRKKMRGSYPYYGASGIIDYVDNYIFDGAYILLGEDGANIIDRSSRLAFIINGKCWVNNHAHVLSPLPSMNIVFLSEYLESIKYDEYNTGTAQPKLNREKCNTIPVLVPSVPEQNHIAQALSDIDDMISSLEKLIEKKKAIKQGAMQDLLTGKKRLPGSTGEWKTQLFEDCFDFIPNNAFTRAEMSDSGLVRNVHYGDILTKYGCWIDSCDAGIPFLSKEIDLSRFSEKCYLQSGDIIIADTAEDETVGKAIEIVNVTVPVLAGQHTLMCRPKIKFAEKFLGYYLNSECYHSQLLPFIVGTKVSSVSKASISQTHITVPAIREQTAIASILSDMDNEIEELEQKLNKTRKLKQGMMQQLLTGKIRLIEKDIVVEPVRTQNNTAKTQTGHNHQFDDAVMIAAIVNAFYSEKYPLGRKKVQKLLYLLRRKQEVDTSAFKKKAAGPYADEVRYKGGEPIAKSNGYISSSTSKKGTAFSKGKNIDDALNYVEKWNKQADIDWLLSTFKYVGVNDLELYATVDMAICDLKHQGIEVTIDSIKNLIRSNDEWKAKLKKKYFSDADIARAIDMSKQLFSN